MGFCLFLSTTLALADGGWIGAASLPTARDTHTATLLPNGNVLVAGGGAVGSGAPFASADVYNAAANKWSATGTLTVARQYHAATLLANGKVLVTGGRNGNKWLTNAELYDPGTGTWAAAGVLGTGRLYHTATLLANGKVLVAGGRNGNTYPVSAELYDPATNTWSPTGSLTTSRAGHTATLVANGKVLVAGGYNNVAYLTSAELYDPATNMWSAAGSLATTRNSHTATLLPSGKVLVAGGGYYTYANFTLASTELYDPASNTWSAAASLAGARAGHTATLMPSGKVMVAGGMILSNGARLSGVELYDPGTKTWSAAAGLSTERSGHTAVLMANGKILVAGGSYSNAGTLASAELYDPAAVKWSGTGALSTTRDRSTMTPLINGKLLIAGGYGNNGPLSNVDLYDSVTAAWTAAAALPTPRYGHTATLMVSGKVLAAGGLGNSGPLANVDLYNPVTNAWTAAGTLAAPRSGHTTTLLASGKVLIAGGLGNTGPLASAELYDPGTNVWMATGTLGAARSGQTATLLPNGKVLVVGGVGSGGVLSSAELYDPATATWTGTAALAAARDRFTATLLPNGRVLVAGGAGSGGILATAELYDPTIATWTATAALAAPRHSHTALLLVNGKVLVAGGVGSGGVLTSAELYDPATAIWTAGGALATARQRHTATLLPDGKMLVAGGSDNSAAYLASAELFDAGLVPDAMRQPTLGIVTQAVQPGTPLVATGSGFRPNWEASGGGTNSSAVNFPLLQVTRLDSGQTAWFPVNAATPFSNTAFTTAAAAFSGFPYGPLRVTIFVSGIPSVARLTAYGIFVPDAPTISTATGGNAYANVAFGAPANNGGAPVDHYRATCTGSISSTGLSSSIHVSPLTNGTTYTCTVAAHNIAGWGEESAMSNSVIPMPSSNANLANLVSSVTALSPTFASGTLGYTAAVANAVTSVMVTPIVADATATVKINGTAVASGSASGPISLGVGNNAITVIVTAEDGITSKTYTVAVSRAASSNAGLSALSLSSGTLTPAFSGGTLSYSAGVLNSANSITVTPTVADPTATVKVNGTTVASGYASTAISLGVGNNAIAVVGTAQDGVSTATYSVVVSRAAGSNTGLSALTLSSGTLTPAFAGDIYIYATLVANSLNSITVTPTTSEPTTLIKVDGAAVASGSPSASIPLAIGNNAIDVVTTQDVASTRTYTVNVTRADYNYQGLWWNAPAGTESGWGINFTHQGDIIFATWFTYDTSGAPWWLIAQLDKTAQGVYVGPVSTVTGPPFNTVPFPPGGSPGGSVETLVGTMMATFADAAHGTIAYTVDGVTQTKAIVPQVFGPALTCIWGEQPNLALATNFTDLWWNAPPGTESGWGINFSHQGDIIFATWFTYDALGEPWWLISQLDKASEGVYAGPVSTVAGPPFSAVPFPPGGSPGGAVETIVGNATITLADGNSAMFAYTVNGTSQAKAITRQVFVSPGTVCH